MKAVYCSFTKGKSCSHPFFYSDKGREYTPFTFSPMNESKYACFWTSGRKLENPKKSCSENTKKAIFENPDKQKKTCLHLSIQYLTHFVPTAIVRLCQFGLFIYFSFRLRERDSLITSPPTCYSFITESVSNTKWCHSQVLFNALNKI